jgi:anti-sigma factor RsiW
VTCKEFLNELTDYLDGAISQKDRAELEEHLHWCHNCFVVLKTTETTIEIHRNQEVYDLPEPLRDKLRAAIMSKCKDAKKSGV